MLGTSIVLHGVLCTDGANFTCTVDNLQPRAGTCLVPTVDNINPFKQELCAFPDLDGSSSHLLTVTHTDLNGLWLNFDFLAYAFFC